MPKEIEADLERMTVEALKQLASDRGVKKERVGWSTCCPPDGLKDDIIQALLAAGQETGADLERMTVEALKELATDRGIKKEGVSWPTCCPPNGLKDNIIQALLAAGQEEDDDETVGMKSCIESFAAKEESEVAELMWEDFTVADLAALAEQYGIKKPGIGWGKDGTPLRRKADLIQAFITRRSKASSYDGEAPGAGNIDTGHWCKFQVEEAISVDNEYMQRGKYRKHLIEGGLLSEDQHIFHIIASANGGPDHPDNYLGALGGVFNCSIGKRMDYFCCFIAGLDKTKKAVTRALEAEALYQKDPSKYHHVIDSRGKSEPILFSTNDYNTEAGCCLTAKELFDRGRQAWAKMRLAALK